MKRRHGLAWSAWCAWGLFFASLPCHALVGTLSPRAMKRLKGHEVNMGLATDAKGIVKELNKMNAVKVGLDPKLAKKSLNISFNGRPFLDSVTLLAEKLKAKAIALGNFVYLGTKLPPGVFPSGKDGKLPGNPAMFFQLPVIFPGARPGQQRNYPWVAGSPKDCLEEGKPLLLYIHDATIELDNPTALFFETVILGDPVMKKALKGFQFVLVDTKSKVWPAAFAARAKQGAAFYFMTCDGRVQGMWSSKMPKAPARIFAGIARRTASANKLAAARRPKPKTVAAQTGKPGKPVKTAFPGLEKNPKKKKPTKAPKKPGKNEEEEEEE